MTKSYKSSLDILHHLAGADIHLQLLDYFYKHQDTIIKHRDIHKLLNGKSSSYTSHYTRAMIKFDLIYRVISPVTYNELGYRITRTGIKFFEMYRKIEKELIIV